MFRNYLKMAARNIIKHKGSSLINIAGLAIGIACSTVIFLFVRYELSYDTFHEKADRIHRVAVRASIGDTKIKQTFSSAITFAKLLEEFPEIEAGVKFLRLGRVPVRVDERTFFESRCYAVDSTFYNVFTVPLIQGDPAAALSEPKKAVISESTAMKYFGRTDVVGSMLRADIGRGGQTFELEVTGVSRDMPPNSHFHYEVLVSNLTFPDAISSTGWTNNNFISYVLLKENTSLDGFETKLADFTRKYMGGDEFDAWVAQGNYWEYFLQPIKRIHLESDLNGEFEPNGNGTYLKIFMALCVIVLLVACINFMNLSTARSSLRAKEISIRKVVGSNRRMLVGQFLFESVLLCFISLAFGVALVKLLGPLYSDLVGGPIELPLFGNAMVIPSLLLLGAVVGIVSGSYPAFILSSFKPVATLGRRSGDGRGGLWIRNALIVLQFSISIFLMVSAVTVYKQLEFIQNKRLGFEKEQVLVLRNPGSLGTGIETFMQTLRDHPGIVNVSATSSLPGTRFNNIGFRAEGVDKGFTLNIIACGYDFLETLGLEMEQGRFFSREFGADTATAVLNEKALALIGWDDPIGKRINNYNDSYFTVVGVVRDYHYESLHSEIRPMALFLAGGNIGRSPTYIAARLETGDVTSVVSEVRSAWSRFASDTPFEYSFLDEDYDNLYFNEMRVRKLFMIFSLLAIFIACLGLLGLASFVADRRTKEIGIRKVLGASAAGIVGLLSMSFIRWVLLANVVAWPLAWFAMNRWLENFAYRTSIGIWSFMLAGALAIVIAFVTVSYQTIRAASANPVDALKYE